MNPDLIQRTKAYLEVFNRASAERDAEMDEHGFEKDEERWFHVMALMPPVRELVGAIVQGAEEIERLTSELEEARLTLAAEQGRAEGAPGEGWVHYDDPTYGQIWEKRYDNGDIVRIGFNGIVHREMCRRKLASRYSTSRAAMLAADASK